MSPLILSFIASTALSVAGYYIHRNSRAKAIDAAIQEWAPIVFDVVNNEIQQNPNMVTHKSAIFLREFRDILVAKGIKVTPEILTQAKAIADSIHYQDKRAQQIQEGQEGQTAWPFPPMPMPAPAQSAPTIG